MSLTGFPTENTNKITNTIAEKIRKTDKLYEQIDVEIKAHQSDVLKSYSWFATQAANALDIKILESWPEPEPHKVRKTLLKSAFVVKKSRAQYEFRYL